MFKAFPVALVLLATTTAAHAQAGDPAAGAKVFMRCAACHAVGPDARNKIGPQLNGVVGRKSGTAAGFTYSAAMAKANLTWAPKVLDAYLLAPAKIIPGNKMLFMGLTGDKDRADVIAYLAQYDASGATKKK